MSAQARVPGIGNGLPVTTDGPDLRSATIVGFGKSTVTFCFDQTVRPGGNPADFRVRSYDSRRYWIGKSIDSNQPEERCLNVSFGVSVAQGTIGEVVGPGATFGTNQFSTAPSSEPLTGSEVSARDGATSGPDLIRVSREGSDLYFTYDEPIAPESFANTATNRNRFGVENQAVLEVTRPLSIGPVPGEATSTTVKARFASNVASEAIMAVSFEGAVTDLGHDQGGVTPSPATELVIEGRDVRSAGGGVYPVSATLYRPQIVEIRFPQIVSALDAAEFRAYSETGEVVVSRATEPTPDGRGVYVDFGADRFGKDPDAFVQVTVSPFAFRALNGGTIGAGRTIALTLAANQRAGYTSGPDLLSARYTTDGDVVYRFDEPVALAPSPAASARLFHLLPLAGFSLAHAASGLARTETPNEIVLRHPDTAQQSVGAAIGGYSPAFPTTVTDRLGYPSPSGSVSYQTEQPPAPAPTPAPQAEAVPQRFGLTTSLVRKKLKRTKKQRNVVKYSGRLSSSSLSCIGRREIRFETRRKNGEIRTIGRAWSNSRGAYALALRKRPKGKVFVIIGERPSDNCGGATLGGINA